MFYKKRSNMPIPLHSSIVLYKQIIEEHQNQSIHESIIPMSCRTTVRVPIPQISYQKLKQSRSSKPASGGRQRRRRRCRGKPAKAVAAVQGQTAWRPTADGSGNGSAEPNSACVARPRASVWSSTASSMRDDEREAQAECFVFRDQVMLMGLGLG